MGSPLSLRTDTSSGTTTSVYGGDSLTMSLSRGSEHDLKRFTEDLCISDTGLHSEVNINSNRLAFFYVLIECGHNGRIRTGVYRKPTATNNLLRWESSHPYNLRQGIPGSVFLPLGGIALVWLPLWDKLTIYNNNKKRMDLSYLTLLKPPSVYLIEVRVILLLCLLLPARRILLTCSYSFSLTP